MQHSVGEQGTSRYLVELHSARSDWTKLELVAARARSAVAELAREGVHVRFLRTIFVPEDEACFLLYEAESPDVAIQAAELAALDVASVHEAVALEHAAISEHEEER